MKAYLTTTGTIFGLTAGLHLWRAIDDRRLLHADPGYFVALAIIGGLSAVLAIWAAQLYRRLPR